MKSVWLIRAGEGSALAKPFEDNGVVAVGWPEIVEDLRSLSRWQLVERLEREGKAGPDQDADELLTFRDQVVTGDLVVTPDTPNQDYLIGQVTGTYEFWGSSPLVDPEHGPYRHVRRVDWWGRGDRRELADHLRKDLGYRRTIRSLPSPAEWARLAGLVQEEGRHGPRVRVPSAPRTGGAGRARSATPKAPKPVVPADKVCPRCGYRKRLTQFIPTSEVCADCRADE
ncbi:MAG: hypothetical protein M3Z03_09570 [Actinomycetota bacterium]|nr:hypothetical protein [Actinomycetota bacterium]